MANEKERQGYFKAAYVQILNQAEILRLRKPESDPFARDMVNTFKDWTILVGGLEDNLPDLPKKE